MAEAATFYLNEAFRHVGEAFEYELASHYFGELLSEINPTDKDRKLANNANYSSETVELLRSDLGQPLSEETISQMSKAWESAQQMARKNTHFFKAKTEVSNISLLGHVNNLGFFIETLVNRHLLFLNMTGKLDDFNYLTLERAQIMNRLIYIFKTELESKKLNLDRVSNLMGLRNKAVHYTPENAKNFKIKLEQLFEIWKQLIRLLELMHKRELFNEVGYHESLGLEMNQFKMRWQNKK